MFMPAFVMRWIPSRCATPGEPVPACRWMRLALEIGKGELLREGGDLAIIAIGYTVQPP